MRLLPLGLLLAGCPDQNIGSVYENRPPEVSITWPTDGLTVPAREPITLLAAAGDPESDATELSIRWLSDADGPLNGDITWANDESAFSSAQGLTAGPHTLTITVSDPDGAAVTDSVFVNAVPNTPPTVAFLAPSAPGAVIRTDERFAVQVQVADAQDEATALALQWGGDVIAYATSLPNVPLADGTVTSLLPLLPHGDVTVQVTVLDRGGATATVETYLTVITDADHDGYEDIAAGGDDCDDTNAAVHPGATELCNGVDDDCFAGPDDTLPAWFEDGDGDLFGDGPGTETCSPPEGWVSVDGDCDDADETRHPGADERCNGVDDDCDDLVDEDPVDAPTWYLDLDGDGQGDALTAVQACVSPGDTYTDVAGDCDDSRGQVFEGARELCNGRDDNCDGNIDEAPPLWYADTDNDDYGDDNHFLAQCDDPGAGWVIDNTDCNDGDPAVHPNAPERCNDSDDNCDHVVDSPPPANATTWYADDDRDTFGDASQSVVTCVAPGVGWTDRAFDCDDADAERNPSADERCNGVDDDCDGQPEQAVWVGVSGREHTDVQSAVAAATDGSLICVDPGVYTGSVDFLGKSLQVRGSGRDATTLSYAAGGPVVSWSSGENASSILADLTVADGIADVGAGLYINGASPRIAHVRVTHTACTSAACEGVGVYVTRSGARIDDLTIDDVTALGDASAPGNLRGLGIELLLWNGGVSGLTVDGVTAQYGNVTGAGLLLRSTSQDAPGVSIDHLTVTNIRLLPGTAVASGSVAVEQARLTMRHFRSLDNLLPATAAAGGGLYLSGATVAITNALIGGNLVGNTGCTSCGGGGIAQGGADTLTLENVDIVGNEVVSGATGVCRGAGLHRSSRLPTVWDFTNVNVVGNTLTCGRPDGAAAYASTVALTNTWRYTNTFDNLGGNTFGGGLPGVPVGDGVLSADPSYANVLFADASLWDMHLRTSSGVRDMGDPALHDADGSRSDIGGYGGPLGDRLP